MSQFPTLSSSSLDAAQAIVAHCRDWLSIFDQVSTSWDAAVAPVKQKPDFSWKEDYDALAAVGREGAHRGQALLTEYMAATTGGSGAGAAAAGGGGGAAWDAMVGRHVIEDAGVAALVDSVFAEQTMRGTAGSTSWGKLVEGQVKGLVEFVRAARGGI